MNDFVAKKLGEVHAFTRAFKDTLEKGKESYTKNLGDKVYFALHAENSALTEKIEQIGKVHDGLTRIMAKSDSTTVKLVEMRDMYVKDQWDNFTELCEWGGFFHGAGIVHFDLVLGTYKGVKIPEVKRVAKQGIAFHKKLLSQSRDRLFQIGKEKSRV